MNLAFGISIALWLILLTIFGFSCVNFGLSVIKPGNFRIEGWSSPFLMFYYSFNTFMFNSIEEVRPAAPVSQALYMAEQLMALLLGAIFISLVISVRGKRYSEELSSLIKDLEDEGEATAGAMRRDFNFDTVEAALMELERLKRDFVKVLFLLSEELR